MIVLTWQSPPKSWARAFGSQVANTLLKTQHGGALEIFPIYFGTES